MRKSVGLAAIFLALNGCVTDRQTDTTRTATEELLISSAADRAADALSQKLPGDSKIFVDTANFDALDGKYAIGAIEDALLRHGDTLVDQRAKAETVVEIRSGASALDDHETLVGIPSFAAPIPLAGTFTLPKIALYDKATQRSVAKFAATAVDAKTGVLVASTAPQYGYAHKTEHIVLLFFSWTTQDILPKDRQPTN
jgi:hypothetical protein